MIVRGARTGAAFVAAVLLVAPGCSSSPARPAAGSTTTTAKRPSPAPYAATGPFAVGVTTLRFDQRRAVVWYPVVRGDESGHAQEIIDIASLLSPALQAKIPAGKRPLYKVPAYENAPAAAGPGHYPLVIFSHGFAGYPEQSATLTTHLASWGFVVAAPDHVERSLDGLLGTAATGVTKMSDLALLQATTDQLLEASRRPGLLHGLVDPTRIVTAGHSAGAGAAYEFASADPRVKAWISYSVGFDPREGPPPAPRKPGMVMLGTTDGILPPAASEQVYAAMHAPKYLVKIDRAGHLVFSDICLIGREAGGVTGIARAIKLPIPESLLKLGSDGCEAGHPPVEKAFPAIDQLSVAFFRWALHIDKSPIGLDTEAVAGLGANVSVDHAG